MTELVPVERWALRQPWLPTSPQQVKAYLKSKHYKIPHDRNTQEETTGEKALEEILVDHPTDTLLSDIIEARHLTKGIGYLYDTFLGKDGKLHPLYSSVPKTGRLSSKAPNLMNLPQGRKGDLMKEIAAAIRASFIPSHEGWLLAEFDWKGIEALLTGYFAEDPAYMRLARLGVHSALAYELLKKPVDLGKSDEELALLFNKLKHSNEYEYVYFKAKKGVHGTAYGMGPFLLSKEIGCSFREAMELQEAFDRMAPKVAKWRARVRMAAHVEGQLQNPFGRILHFWEVYRPQSEKDGTVTLYKGKESNEAVAFLPQSTAAIMLRETLISLGNHPLEGVAFNLLVPTHDSITFDVDPDRFEEVMHIVKTTMERKWPELNGLSVETEAKYGKTMQKNDMKDWKG